MGNIDTRNQKSWEEKFQRRTTKVNKNWTTRHISAYANIQAKRDRWTQTDRETDRQADRQAE